MFRYETTGTYDYNHIFTADVDGTYVVNLDAQADVNRAGDITSNGKELHKITYDKRNLTSVIAYYYLEKGQTITFAAKGSNNFQTLNVSICRVYGYSGVKKQMNEVVEVNLCNSNVGFINYYNSNGNLNYQRLKQGVVISSVCDWASYNHANWELTVQQDGYYTVLVTDIGMQYPDDYKIRTLKQNEFITKGTKFKIYNSSYSSNDLTIIKLN